MKVRSRGMRQVATYWAPTEPDRYGQMGFAGPELIKVRWKDESQVSVDSEGREFTSSAIVYVSKEVEVQGYIAQGDHEGTSDPTGVDGAYEIRRVGQSPALRRNEKLIKVWV